MPTGRKLARRTRSDWLGASGAFTARTPAQMEARAELARTPFPRAAGCFPSRVAKGLSSGQCKGQGLQSSTNVRPWNCQWLWVAADWLGTGCWQGSALRRAAHARSTGRGFASDASRSKRSCGLRLIMVTTSDSLTPFSNTVWAKTRKASDGIGLCRWPVSDTSRQREAPTRLTAATIFSGAAYCQAGEMVQ